MKQKTVIKTYTVTNKLHTNKDANQFNSLQSKIINKSESETSFDNSITKHYKKFITDKALREVEFKEWKQNIYIEFTVDKNKQIVYYKTNTSSRKLDSQIKIAFRSFEFEMMRIQNFDPIYKYSIVVVQNINNKPTVKCNQKAIGYIPPIFKKCLNEKTYDNLNKCNYTYITEHLYNTVDLTSLKESEIDNRNEIYSKFIVDKKGVVIAAKVEAKNKKFIEAYYNAIKSIPSAIKPAQFNNKNEYYGYNFPTSIPNIISNNKNFKKVYSNKKNLNTDKGILMKLFLHKLHKEKRVSCNYLELHHKKSSKNIHSYHAAK